MKKIRFQEKYVRLLKGTPIFVDSGVDLLLASLRDKGAEFYSFEKNEIIFGKNNRERKLLILLSGQAEVFKMDSEGRQIMLSIRESGSVLGAASLFNQWEEYVSMISARKKTEVLFLSEELFENMLRQDFRLTLNYIRFLSDSIHFLNRKIDRFTGPDSVTRLANFFLDHLNPETSLLSFPYNFVELSSVLNIGRASLYRAFDDLIGAGVIERRGKELAVPDRERLKAYC